MWEFLSRGTPGICGDQQWMMGSPEEGLTRTILSNCDAGADVYRYIYIYTYASSTCIQGKSAANTFIYIYIYGSFPRYKGNPIQTPKYYNPYYGDPEVPLILGNPHIHTCTYLCWTQIALICLQSTCWGFSGMWVLGIPKP